MSRRHSRWLLVALVLLVAVAPPPARAADGAPIPIFDLPDVPGETQGMNVLGQVGPWLIGSSNAGVSGNEIWRMPVAGGPGELLADIDPGIGEGFYYPAVSRDPVAQLSNVLLFLGRNESVGREIWRTDGTPAGTYRLPEFAPGHEDGVSPGFILEKGLGDVLYEFNDEAYVIADDGLGGQGLWKTDGTASGTVLLASGTGALACCQDAWAEALGKLFFRAGGMLWVTDGTAPGTQSLATVSMLLNRPQMYGAGSRVFFRDASSKLWTSDGTIAGTTSLQTASLTLSSYEMVAQTIGGSETGRVFLRSSASRLWISDGTELGTLLLTPTANASIGRVADDGRMFFAGYDAATGGELWVSDGTPGGTHLVVDLVPGSGNASPGSYAALGTGMFFVSGSTPRFSDGTAPGTIDLAPQACCPAGPTAVIGGAVLFEGYDATVGWSLYRSDGTPGGTSLLADLNTEPGATTQTSGIHFVDSTYAYLQALDGVDYFLARSDGTSFEAIGTTPRRSYDLTPGGVPQEARSERLAAQGGALFFAAADGAIHRSDGTSAGTAPIVGPTSGLAGDSFAFFQGELYFTQNDELWKTDGTLGGATLLSATGGDKFAELGGELYYLTASALWKTDGTAPGTVQVQNLGVPSLEALTFVLECGGLLYFDGHSAAASTELWSSDGTAAGTNLLLDINPGAFPAFSAPGETTCQAGKLFFAANSGASNEREPWVSDGTALGTQRVADIQPGTLSSYPTELTAVGTDTVFLAAEGPRSTARELWRLDAGALTATEFDLAPGSASSLPRTLTEFGPIYFAANDGSAGRELWTAPTAGTTAQQIDIVAGAEGSYPTELRDIGGTLWLTACAAEGCEVWSSDGTAGGTTLRADVVAGPMPSTPLSFESLGDAIFFIAHGPVRGSAVWGMSLACGDAIQGPAEECDDGNALVGDGCTPGCEAETELVLSGLAAGGSVTLTIDGVTLVVDTLSGQTPLQVIENIEAAINAHPYLAALRGTATSAGPILTTTGEVTSVVLSDPGLSDAPAVPAAGLVPWILGMCVLLGIGTGALRRRTSSGRA